ncbi:MAG TPA: zinc ribbon domain-containing protein [Solirubrobacteraceae bacterium]|nr:zinc ribbon domain-containing protein [Solirubrobacteraceae bacterium]
MVPVAYFGIESSGLNLVIDLLIVFVVVVYLSLIYWTYADARRRIEDPMLIGCAVAASLFPFVGTIVYVILRPPEYLEDVRERELEIKAAQARLHELDNGLCPHCDYRVERDFIRCPSCLRKLKERCVSCGRPLDRTWPVCPYCETEVPDAAPLRRRRRRRGQADEDILLGQRDSDTGLARELDRDAAVAPALESDPTLPPASALGGASFGGSTLEGASLGGSALEGASLGGSALDGSTLEDALEQPSSVDGGPALSAGATAPVLRDDRRDERPRRSRRTIARGESGAAEDDRARPYEVPDEEPPRPRSGRARYPRSSS